VSEIDGTSTRVEGQDEQIYTAYTREVDDVYFYGLPVVRSYLQTINNDNAHRTVAQFCEDHGITLASSNLTTDYKLWFNITTPTELVSDLFWTVFADDGIHFINQTRTGVYRGIVTRSQIIVESNLNPDYSIGYEGETGYDMTIAVNSKAIIPDYISLSEKKACVNKLKMKSAQIQFESGLEMEPGDWVQYDGRGVYIVISRYEMKSGLRYVAVKEVNEDYSFTGESVPGLLQQGDDTHFSTGFVNHVDSVITYDATSKTITIAPSGAYYDVYMRGRKHRIVDSYTTEAHDNTAGNYFLYFDEYMAPTLDTSAWSIIDDAPITLLYYSTTKGAGILLEERHTCKRNVAWHYADHFERGTYIPIKTDFALTYTLQPASPSDADIQWTLGNGTIKDEDIAKALTGVGVSTYVVWYRTGASGEWIWFTGRSIPYYFTTSGYININTFAGGTWGLSQASANQYINYYVLGIPAMDSTYHIMIVAGQVAHASLALAQGETFSSLSLGTLPSQELVVIYKITYRTNASYGTSGKVRIEAVEDLRGSTLRSVIASNVAVHNALSGIQGGASGAYYHSNQPINITDSVQFTKAGIGQAIDSTYTLAVSGASSGLFSGAVTLGGNQTFGTQAIANIYRDTDARRLNICGGTLANVANGAYISVLGDSYTATGHIYLASSNNGNIDFYTGVSGTATLRGRVSNAGLWGIGGAVGSYTMKVYGTSSIETVGAVKIGGAVGFNNVTPLAKPTITGSRGGNAALASLLTQLANYGLITDSTTA
jgi:hypothetical protein